MTGLGEAYTLPCRERAIAEIIHALGRASRSVRDLSPQTFSDFAARIAGKHRGMDFAAATNALEMALWDIEGKRRGQPVCELLGGDWRRAIPVYGNIWSESQWDTPSLVARAKALVSLGYQAIKLHPLLNHDVHEAAQCVASVRAAVGPDIALMIDLDSQDDPALAQTLDKLIAPANPYWFEEPIDGEEITSLAEIRRGTKMRIVSGEKQSGQAHFRALLAGDAADILNPDIAAVGGILDMVDIAAMAARQGVALSPHCWNSMTVAAAAMLHLCAAIPNAEMAELYPEYFSYGRRFAMTDFTLDGGTAHLSDKPGLGVEIDADALRACATDYRESELGMEHVLA